MSQESIALCSQKQNAIARRIVNTDQLNELPALFAEMTEAKIEMNNIVNPK